MKVHKLSYSNTISVIRTLYILHLTQFEPYFDRDYQIKYNVKLMYMDLKYVLTWFGDKTNFLYLLKR